MWKKIKKMNKTLKGEWREGEGERGGKGRGERRRGEKRGGGEGRGGEGEREGDRGSQRTHPLFVYKTYYLMPQHKK